MVSRLFRCVFFFAACAFATVSTADGPNPPARVEPDEIKVFSLQNMSPDEAASILSRVYAGPTKDSPRTLKLGPDQRTKCLVVKGEKDTLKEVEALLLRLDEVKTTKSVLRKLDFASAEDVQSVVRESVPNVDVHLDKRTNSILVTGQPEGVDRVQAIVKFLDIPPKEVQDVSIRIVWLVEKSLMDEKAPAVPTDLSPSIDALRKKVSLGELRTAAQILVRCTPEESSTFEASGTANLQGDPLSLQFQGQVKRTEADRYSIQVQGSTRVIGLETAVCQVRTNCASVPIGQAVILGTTSIDSRASVFVIQILEK